MNRFGRIKTNPVDPYFLPPDINRNEVYRLVDGAFKLVVSKRNVLEDTLNARHYSDVPDCDRQG